MTPIVFGVVGGGRDGGEVRVEGTVPPGTEFRFALAHDSSRCEVYVLGADGRLRFDRYAPAGFGVLRLQLRQRRSQPRNHRPQRPLELRVPGRCQRGDWFCPCCKSTSG